jgi:hypothetical protein
VGDPKLNLLNNFCRWVLLAKEFDGTHSFNEREQTDRISEVTVILTLWQPLNANFGVR